MSSPVGSTAQTTAVLKASKPTSTSFSNPEPTELLAGLQDLKDKLEKESQSCIWGKINTERKLHKFSGLEKVIEVLKINKSIDVSSPDALCKANEILRQQGKGTLTEKEIKDMFKGWTGKYGHCRTKQALN